jgi:hypothetical protein
LLRVAVDLGDLRDDRAGVIPPLPLAGLDGNVELPDTPLAWMDSEDAGEFVGVIPDVNDAIASSIVRSISGRCVGIALSAAASTALNFPTISPSTVLARLGQKKTISSSSAMWAATSVSPFIRARKSSTVTCRRRACGSTIAQRT